MEYSFSAKSWHVKLYKFLWFNGYNPVNHYNTMCPYFWMTILGLVLSPLLIFRTVFLFVGGYIEEKIENSKLARSTARMEKYLLALDNMTDKSTESLTVFLSKMGWKVNRNAVLKKYEDDPDRWAILEAMYDIESNRKYIKEEQCQKDKQAFQKKVDKIRYNPYVSKALAGIAFIAAAAVGIVVLYLVYLFFYWLLHLFTFQQFLNAAGFFLFGVTFGGIIVFIFFIISKIWTILFSNVSLNIDCVSPFNRWIVRPLGVMFKGIWSVILTVIELIVSGVVIVIDMIKSIYHQSCPRVTWKK